MEVKFVLFSSIPQQTAMYADGFVVCRLLVEWLALFKQSGSC